MIKVFISHQAADGLLAADIARRLKTRHEIDSYLDLIDPNIQKGEDLALHIQTEMGKCTQLLAVVSEKTQQSWWVPWEIGVATEKDYPLATYAEGATRPPEYLRKWPYLRSHADLDLYAKASRAAQRSLIQKRATLNEGVARFRATRDFYSILRKDLGQ
ncbi:toll/interleukin-1 receptor domain-containing protein [Sinorhizobium chiapasense]|uniref:Toll/interleukin-1 receptor domain-containing protein n=1 Tax=Sinorhizobium chiapasense TaxID=501572 RepID=A0ABZ2BGG0_9HYPH